MAAPEVGQLEASTFHAVELPPAMFASGPISEGGTTLEKLTFSRELLRPVLIWVNEAAISPF
jgi:hypothetical protein